MIIIIIGHFCIVLFSKRNELTVHYTSNTASVNSSTENKTDHTYTHMCACTHACTHAHTKVLSWPDDCPYVAKFLCCDFLRCYKYKTLHSGSTHWALPLHTTFSDLGCISRSQQIQTVSTDNSVFLSSFEFTDKLIDCMNSVMA